MVARVTDGEYRKAYYKQFISAQKATSPNEQV